MKLRALALLSACAAAMLSGSLIQSPPELFAQPASTAEREAFKSGGARAADTLAEIAVILGRIDTRLERIEKRLERADADESGRSRNRER